MKSGLLHRRSALSRRAQSGYIMIAVLLTLALMVIAMTVAAPKVAQQAKREREEEMIHRGTEYARAVKKYFHKFHRYPTSIEQLENTNNIRFLRKKYADPMNPEGVWHIVRAGEVQLSQPLTGAGGVPPPGGPPTLGGPATPGPSPLGGTPPPDGAPVQTEQKKDSNGITGQTFGGGAMMGVSSLSKAKGIHEFNNKAEYAQWFFIYDQNQDLGLLRGPYNPKAIFGNSKIKGAKTVDEMQKENQR